MARVAVVGLGAMGGRVAKRLCNAGHDVIVWNRSREKLLEVVALGATAVRTPRDSALMSEMVITMVSDPHALRAVTEGDDGLVAGARAGLIVLEMSTVGRPAIHRLSSALPSGVGLVDAPVLGSVTAAETGKLTIFAGGPDALVDRVEPLLSELGTVLHAGPLGAGAASKLIANAALFGTLAVLGEALAMAEAMGLDRRTAATVLASTPLAEQVERRLPSINSKSYPCRFALSLAAKDANLITTEAVSTGAAIPVLAAAGNWMAMADREGRSEQDYTAVLATILGQSDSSDPAVFTAEEEAGGFDGLIVDLDGVVWLGDEPIAGAVAALTALRESGFRIVFLTNDPEQGREDQARRLNGIGVQAEPSDVFTAGTVTAAYLAKQHLDGARALVIGSAALKRDVCEAGLKLVTATRPKDAAIVVVGGHNSFGLTDLRAATAAVCAGAAFYATGRDPFVPTAGGRDPGTGAIVAAIETATGVTATLTGKPEPHVFAMASARLEGCKRIAVVGDSLVADIVGAKQVGLYSILVLSGATRQEDLIHATTRPDRVFSSLAATAKWLVKRG